jgi:hypothetical protein
VSGDEFLLATGQGVIDFQHDMRGEYCKRLGNLSRFQLLFQDKNT